MWDNNWFLLRINSTSHDLPTEFVVKSSRRCARLFRSGEHSLGIKTRLAPSDWDPWVLTDEYAFALFDVAQQLEAPELKRFLANYIAENKLRRSAPTDPLGSLLKALNSDNADEELIGAVAEIAHEVVLDKRAFYLPPEILFKILLAAPYRDLDPEVLGQFTLRFFQRNPSAAVPLILLIDFDRLLPGDADRLFATREVHRENLNFFIGAALSATRSKASNALQDRLEYLNSAADSLFQARDTWLDEKIAEASKRETSEIEALRAEIEAQGRELADLVQELAEDQETLAAQKAEQRRQLDELRAEIEAMAASTADAWKPFDIVESEVDKLRDELVSEVARVQEEESAAIGEVRKKYTDVYEEAEAEITRIEKAEAEIMKSAQESVASVAEARATIFVKIVRDRIKRRPVKRKTEKLAIFRTGSLPVDTRQAHQADQFLRDIAKKIDEICPIVGRDIA
jgi:hypothetical protein